MAVARPYRRPLIGITGSRKAAFQLAGTAEALRHLAGDWFYADNARGVLGAGGVPMYLAPDADPGIYSGHLDGLLLTGGEDVDPLRFGRERDSATDDYPPDPTRDQFELDILSTALEAEITVLGICRGLQLINVAMGGTLHQHVPEHVLIGEGAPTERHGLELVADSVLARLYPDDIQINSLHHQTIDRLGNDLRITAHADIDRTIEGIEHLRKPIVAVQWHPELLPTCPTDPVFRWLVDEASSAY